MHFAIGEVAVDLGGHFHHAAGYDLLGVLVAGAVLHVAEVAILSESGAHATHRGADLFGLEDFEILGRAATAASLFRGVLFGGVLSAECQRSEQQCCGEITHVCQDTPPPAISGAVFTA